MHAERDVGLLRLLRVDLDAAVGVRRHGLRLAGLGVHEVAEKLLRSLEQAVADAAPDPENHP